MHFKVEKTFTDAHGTRFDKGDIIQLPVSQKDIDDGNVVIEGELPTPAPEPPPEEEAEAASATEPTPEPETPPA